MIKKIKQGVYFISITDPLLREVIYKVKPEIYAGKGGLLGNKRGPTLEAIDQLNAAFKAARTEWMKKYFERLRSIDEKEQERGTIKVALDLSALGPILRKLNFSEPEIYEVSAKISNAISKAPLPLMSSKTPEARPEESHLFKLDELEDEEEFTAREDSSFILVEEKKDPFTYSQ